MLWNEKEYNNRSSEIYARCCGFTTDYLFEILSEFSRIKSITAPEGCSDDIARNNLIDLVFHMVANTQVSNKAGTVFWILPGGRYFISLKKVRHGRT